ncbi:MAG: trehalase family glycosidase [Bacteroidales bacterium]|nr:trehalase family glycosidase [Bacteroidales bacterium]
MCKEAGEGLQYPFLTPGSSQYADVLWDWDSWFSNIALRQILLENGTQKDRQEMLKYEQGCILNFLTYCRIDGWMPVNISRRSDPKAPRLQNILETNMHKPCIAQHAAFICKLDGGHAEWLKDKFYYMQCFLSTYRNHFKNKDTGLFFWANDGGIGVDNDPCTYYRPRKSSGSIYLNCMMYKELKAMVYLCKQLNLDEIAPQYEKEANALKAAILENCWDERDGFYYSVDLNLLPVESDSWKLHSGAPRDWNCLIQRIGVWSGFMAMWADIATPEQAKRMVAEHYNNPKTFNAPYGVRSLSKMEKMYSLKATGNPSSWLGPVWGISNYITWKGLVKYGFTKEAKELAAKTIVLFGKDFEKNGALHEYYQPENGEPILNKGFQNWNYLVLNMLAWMEGRPVVEEF